MIIFSNFYLVQSQSSIYRVYVKDVSHLQGIMTVFGHLEVESILQLRELKQE